MCDQACEKRHIRPVGPLNIKCKHLHPMRIKKNCPATRAGISRFCLLREFRTHDIKEK